MAEPGAGSRRERANPALDVRCRRPPVDGGLVFLQLRRVGRAVGWLRHFGQCARCQRARRVHDQSGGERGKHVVQRTAGGLRSNGHCLRGQDGAGVETFVHSHDGDARLLIARHDRTLDRRGAPPARQQRSMGIDAAEPRRGKHGRRQDQAVGDRDREVRTQRRKRRLRLLALQARRSPDRKPRSLGAHRHRRRPHLAAALRRARRLGVDSSDGMAARAERVESRNRIGRRSHEHQPERLHDLPRMRGPARDGNLRRRQRCGAPWSTCAG